jgi:hypothetical protein
MKMAEKTAACVEAEEDTKPQSPRPASPDQRLVYTRLANEVRQAVAMYACIEAGLVPLAPRYRTERDRAEYPRTHPRNPQPPRSPIQGAQASPTTST